MHWICAQFCVSLFLDSRDKSFNLCGFQKFMRIPRTIFGFHLQYAESAYNLRIPLTICGFHLQLLIPPQLKFTQHRYYNFLMDSKNWFRIPLVLQQILQNACFSSNFEQYSNLANCPWNPKQQRRSKKSSQAAVSATNLNFDCCGILLQFTKCTFWPRNVPRVFFLT